LIRRSVLSPYVTALAITPYIPILFNPSSSTDPNQVLCVAIAMNERDCDLLKKLRFVLFL